VSTPSSGVYATVQQYRDVTKDEATPDDRVEMWLQLASEALDIALIGAIYKVDADEMPTDPKVAGVFVRACCRQAQYEIANNDPAQVKDQYTSSSVGGVSYGRAASATGRALPPLAPRALAILQVAGVLPGAPMISW
jgi:hypothetical protein